MEQVSSEGVLKGIYTKLATYLHIWPLVAMQDTFEKNDTGSSNTYAISTG